ncbi:LLM class flavin-dependent oxidoreductase [Pseudonocardia sp. NPDC049154]|uniref:LLM class flavin-dependent oxidoreductase n=1 Tax=Pseudonocardia sp. NPDC049154 TaxID=3155501 RepID=UPI0033FE53B1
MPDHRHDLLFGAFVTPVADPPDRAVDLAVAAERAGLDLVAFQDHPYLPEFLDAWTLMSVVAARTERIRLTGDVLNLPLRPPAVLARSAASLDRLSGGRVELGLGTGAFWDGIEAMGGRRLKPGESVQALEEAIAILRGIWAADERGGVRVDGEFHHVAGAKRGPHQPTTSASGSAPTAPACSGSSAAWPTAGCPRSPTCATAPPPSPP